jgi:hypothetical protein
MQKILWIIVLILIGLTLRNAYYPESPYTLDTIKNVFDQNEEN